MILYNCVTSIYMQSDCEIVEITRYSCEILSFTKGVTVERSGIGCFLLTFFIQLLSNDLILDAKFRKIENIFHNVYVKKKTE